MNNTIDGSTYLPLYRFDGIDMTAGSTGASIIGPIGPTGASIIGPTGASIIGPIGPTGASIIGPTGSSIIGPIGPTGASIIGPMGPQGPSVSIINARYYCEPSNSNPTIPFARELDPNYEISLTSTTQTNSIITQINTFGTLSALNVSQIPSGEWSCTFWAKMANPSESCLLTFNVYVYHPSTTSTTSIGSGSISIVGDIKTQYYIAFYCNTLSCALTDYLYFTIDLSSITTSSTLTTYYQGTNPFVLQTSMSGQNGFGYTGSPGQSYTGPQGNTGYWSGTGTMYCTNLYSSGTGSFGPLNATYLIAGTGSFGALSIGVNSLTSSSTILSTDADFTASRGTVAVGSSSVGGNANINCTSSNGFFKSAISNSNGNFSGDSLVGDNIYYTTNNLLLRGGGTLGNAGIKINTSNNVSIPNTLTAGTGVFGPLVSSSLTGSRLLLSDSSKKIVSSSITDTETSYLSGASSNIQTQINNKFDKSGGTLTGNLNMGSNYIQTTGTGVFGYIYSGYIDCPNIVGTIAGGALTATSIVNSGTMSSGASTFSGSISAGSNYIQTTGTGVFGPLVCSSLYSNGISNFSNDLKVVNNKSLMWADSSGSYQSVLYTNTSDQTLILPTKSTGNVQIKNFAGTPLLTVSTASSVFANKVDAGSNYITTTGTGSFGRISGRYNNNYSDALSLYNPFYSTVGGSAGDGVATISFQPTNPTNNAYLGTNIGRLNLWACTATGSPNILMGSTGSSNTQKDTRILGKSYTQNNTLDDGSGNMSVSGLNSTALTCTSLTCNGNASIAGGDVYHTNNRALYWADNVGTQQLVLWTNPSNETNIRPTSSAANVQIQNFGGTPLLTLSTATSTFTNTINAGANPIYTSGTGSFGTLSTGVHLFPTTTGTPALPTFTTRSSGTRVVIYPEVDASNTDHAIGVASSTMWYSVPNASNSHKWYAGTSLIGTLSGTGNLTTSGNISAGSSYIITTGTGSFGALNSTALTCTSLTCNGNASIAGGDVYHTNNRALYWGDNVGTQQLVLWTNPSNETNIRPTSSAANVQIQNFGGTPLLTVSSATTTVSNTINFPSQTASRVAVYDSSKNLVSSSVSSTELGYLSGVSSGIQGQINSKQASISGLMSTSCWANTYSYNVYGAMANAYTFTINSFSQIANFESTVYTAYRPSNITLYSSFGLNGYTINYSSGYPQYYQVELSARTNDYSGAGSFGISLYTDPSNLLIGSMTKQRETWGSIDSGGRSHCYFSQLVYLNSQTTNITFAMYCTQSNRYVYDYNLKITPVG